MVRFLILLLTLTLPAFSASPFKWKKSHDKDAGAYIGLDKLRPTTDTTPFKIQNKAGSSDIMIIDLGTMQIGVKKTPTQDLDVDGTVKATSFIGDGSQLSGLEVTGAALPSFTVTSTDHQALTKQYVLVDSNVQAIEVTPPVTSVGNWFVVADIGQASVNPIRVLTNGSKIMSSTNNILIDADRVFVKFVYADVTRGWIIEGP